MKKILPISAYKNEIVESVDNNAVTIIVGETGSGKSTKVPKYLYYAGYEVTIAEPRILAAVTLANWVQEDMDAEEGLVAYHTGFECNVKENTRIRFCTDGLQLVRSLTKRGNARRKQVLIIDELHEWNLNQETLIAWSKLNIENGWNCKLVIESATIEHENLSDFFGDCNIIQVPGRVYPVEEFHYSEYEFIPSIINCAKAGENVLAFVAGKREIEETISKLEEYGVRAKILPLHGELSWYDQQACFDSYNIPKIIISTNVAQTSVTVPDIDTVVDSGEERHASCRNGIQGVFLNHISKADCMQRKGRAGRTKPGKYILCSNFRYSDRQDFSTPEIQRSLLEQVVLRLSSVKIDARELEFFHQPDADLLTLAHETLEKLGALKDNSITELGKKMAHLPLSARNSRMLLAAEELGVVDDVITIAAILEIGSLLAPKKDSSYLRFTSEDSSDLLAELDVWNYIEKYGIETYQDFKYMKLNYKAYGKIVDLRDKLDFTVKNLLTMGTTGDREAIKRACSLGMMDMLCQTRDSFSGSGIECVCANGDVYNLDKKSVTDSSDYIVGIPRTIEFEGRYGNIQRLTVFGNTTAVDIQALMEENPNLVTTKYDIYSGWYSSEEDVLVIQQETYFNGLRVKTEWVKTREHEKYFEEKQEYERREYERESSLSRERKRREEEIARRQKTVLVDGKPYEVEYDWRGQDPYIIIGFEDLLKTNETCLKLEKGTVVSIHCDGQTSNNTVSLLTLLKAKRTIRAKEKLEDSLPTISSTKCSIIMSELLPHVGAHCICDFITEKKYAYVYLTVVSGSVKLGVTSDEDKAQAETADALKHIVMLDIRNNYGEKKFKVKINGKAMVTKKCERAKQEFDSFVECAIESIDQTNILETLEFVREAFEECTRELGQIAS